MLGMQMHGGVVGFNDYSTLSVKKVLSELSSNVSEGASWSRAFQESGLTLSAISRGTYLVDTIGQEQSSPVELFTASSPFMTDGSWMVFKDQSEDAATIMMVNHGSVLVGEVDSAEVQDVSPSGQSPKEALLAQAHQALKRLDFEPLSIL